MSDYDDDTDCTLEPPDYLSAAEKKHFREIVENARGLVTYTEFDIGTIALYCIEHSRERTAERNIAAQGLVKNDQLNPWTTIALEATDRLIRLGDALGMNPLARARMS